MPRRRDRHGRGLRGPLALPNRYLQRAVPLRHPTPRRDVFLDCIGAAVAQVQQTCPAVLVGVDIGTEEVPGRGVLWREDRVPLAAAVDATPQEPARIVLYERPLERRAHDRETLRTLVHRTLVEQLSALTGRSVTDIDPDIDLDD